MSKKYNTLSKKEILEQMEKFEGSLFHRDFLEESQVHQGATENSGNITNKDTSSLHAKDKTHTSTGQLAEDEEVEESIACDKATENSGNITNPDNSIKESRFNTNNKKGKNLEQVGEEQEKINVSKTIDDSGKVYNTDRKGENSKDTWKLGSDRAKEIMNQMGKFFGSDRSKKSIQFNEENAEKKMHK